jgi:site-specific recombinase XerD
MVSYPKTAWSATADHQSTTADAGSGRAGSAAARITVHEAIVDFLQAAEDGSTLDRYGRSFSRDALRELRWCLSGHVDDRLGTMRLGQVRRRDIEALIDQLAGAGLSRRRLRAVVKSVRALYDYASERGFADGNPAERVALPD